MFLASRIFDDIKPSTAWKVFIHFQLSKVFSGLRVCLWFSLSYKRSLMKPQRQFKHFSLHRCNKTFLKLTCISSRLYKINAQKVSVFGVILVRFSCIWTEYGQTWSISPYSVRLRENLDQNNSEYVHFLRSDIKS